MNLLLGWEKFGSGERALRVRLEKGWTGRTLVACYKSFSPCSVIPESGYPFSDGTRATIKLLLLAHSFISATADRIYFVVARPGKRIASSDEGCGHRNCCSFRTDSPGQSERHPAVNIRLISPYFVVYRALYYLSLKMLKMFFTLMIFRIRFILYSASPLKAKWYSMK